MQVRLHLSSSQWWYLSSHHQSFIGRHEQLWGKQLIWRSTGSCIDVRKPRNVGVQPFFNDTFPSRSNISCSNKYRLLMKCRSARCGKKFSKCLGVALLIWFQRIFDQYLHSRLYKGVNHVFKYVATFKWMIIAFNRLLILRYSCHFNGLWCTLIVQLHLSGLHQCIFGRVDPRLYEVGGIGSRRCCFCSLDEQN